MGLAQTREYITGPAALEYTGASYLSEEHQTTLASLKSVSGEQHHRQADARAGYLRVNEHAAEKPRDPSRNETRGITHSPPTKTQDHQEEMGHKESILPSLHPATPALYIKNLIPPLRLVQLKAHLRILAGFESDEIKDYYVDGARTHALAMFESISAAMSVRAGLHHKTWPDEPNRRPLWVDFVPPEKVKGWVREEEADGRRGPR